MVGYKGEADEDLVPRLVSYVLDFGNSIWREDPNIEIRNSKRYQNSVTLSSLKKDRYDL